MPNTRNTHQSAFTNRLPSERHLSIHISSSMLSLSSAFTSRMSSAIRQQCHQLTMQSLQPRPAWTVGSYWQYVTSFGICHKSKSVAARPHFFQQELQSAWSVRKWLRSAPVASGYVKSWLLDSEVIHWRGIDRRSWLPFISPLRDAVCWVSVYVIAGNVAEKGTYGYAAATEHAGLSSQSVYPLQLCAWVVVVQCLTEQVTMAVVRSAGSWWWCKCKDELLFNDSIDINQ